MPPKKRVVVEAAHVKKRGADDAAGVPATTALAPGSPSPAADASAATGGAKVKGSGKMPGMSKKGDARRAEAKAKQEAEAQAAAIAAAALVPAARFDSSLVLLPDPLALALGLALGLALASWTTKGLCSAAARGCTWSGRPKLPPHWRWSRLAAAPPWSSWRQAARGRAHFWRTSCPSCVK